MRLYWSFQTRRGLRLRPRYVLRIGIEKSPAEAALITRHRLGRDQLAVAPAALEAEEAAESALDLAKEIEGWDSGAMRKAIGLKTRGLVTALVTMRREATITVGELARGTTVESDSMNEIAMMLELIEAGFRALETQLAMLARFDLGDEGLSDEDVTDDGIRPADWGSYR